MNRDDEMTLVRAIADGDEQAESAFDRMFRAKVETFVCRRRVPGRDCSDVVQDILTDALRQLRQGKFRGDARLSTWLHAIINGGVTNYFRKHGGPEFVSLDDLVAGDHRSLIANQDSHTVLAVREALSRLPTEDDFLLRLYHQQGWTLEEIGPMVGLRKSAVGERLKAAEERFRIAVRDGGKNPNAQRLKD
jgi:RNA polymerase sigma factor (sigma-70 family)